MKVLILATDVFSRGGIARYTSTLASSLASLLGPRNVDVLCFFDWGYSGELPSEFRVLGMVSGRGRAGVLSRLNFLCKAAGAGTRRYDLVIANHVALAPVAAMMKLAFRTPYWVSCHSVEVWWGTSRLRHAALKNADLILPVSRYTADVVQKLDGIQSSRLKVVYNAIPNSFVTQLQSGKPLKNSLSSEARVELAFRPASTFAFHPEPALAGGSSCVRKSGPLLLSVCSMVRGNEFKGIDTVIRALPKILKALPDLRYAVVGDGEIRPRLETLAAEAGVAQNVTFLGEVSDAELAELYRRCDLFVLPSRGQERQGVVGGEGFGRVYVEAALAGKPVVGSLSGGASEAVLHGKTGLLVNPDSTDDVANAVLTILQDPQLAARMGSAGRGWAFDTFSEAALSRSLQELLRPYGIASQSLPKLVHAGGQP
jgi:glycosyltransferase involved in cell wall biosynthesis